MTTQSLTRRIALLAAAVAMFIPESGMAGEPHFRTDINPALLYFQAYQQLPQHNETDSKHLFESWTGGSWPDQPFDERALGLIKQYDNAFKLVRRARFSQVPCDWGYDLTDGPEALLGGLAPAKRIAQVTRFRAMIALDAGRFDALIEDVAAVHALGRNLATDRVLISALVQIAIEDILKSIVMEQYYRLSAEQLDRLVAVFDSGPRRGTIADTIPTEKDAFYGYIVRNVERLLAEAKGSDDVFWPKFESFWNPIATAPESGSKPDPSAAAIKAAAGGSTAGLLKLLSEMPPLYERTARLMSMPYPQYEREREVFSKDVEGSTNPFLKQFFTVHLKVRAKEFRCLVRQEMVRAAAAYKRGGMEAMKAVQNPLVGGAFEFSRVQFEGVDRGFQLKSSVRTHDHDEVMIFIEKAGKHFRLDGKNAGKGL